MRYTSSMVQAVGAMWDVAGSKKEIEIAAAREGRSAGWFVSGFLGFVSVC